MNATRFSNEVLARFWAKVDRTAGAGACWPWTGTVNEHGYGSFWDGDRLVRAHRFALEIDGPALGRLVADHECHNESDCTDVPCQHRRCVNPSHLEAVTQSVNSIRGRSGDHQSSKTHCVQGHEYTAANTLHRNGGRHRVCRTCNRASQARYNQKRKAA